MIVLMVVGVITQVVLAVAELEGLVITVLKPVVKFVVNMVRLMALLVVIVSMVAGVVLRRWLVMEQVVIVRLVVLTLLLFLPVEVGAEVVVVGVFTYHLQESPVIALLGLMENVVALGVVL